MNTHEDRSYAGSKLSLNNLKEMKSQNVFLDDKGIKLKVYAGDLPRGARREREKIQSKAELRGRAAWWYRGTGF